VPQVVRQRDRLRQLGGQARPELRLLKEQVVGDRPGDLGGLDAVSQARAVEIGLPDPEHLCFPLQPAEGGAVQDPVPVALGGMTVIPWGGGLLRVAAFQQKLFHVDGLVQRAAVRAKGCRSG
jgi:hypothetical protein